MYTKILELVNTLKLTYNLEDNISFSTEYRDDIYRFKSRTKNKIDFYICLSKEINDPRIELQISNPFSSNQSDYLIIGEFYDFEESVFDDIIKVIKAILSNKVKIIEYVLDNKIIKREYLYGYYLKDKAIITSETFKKIFISSVSSGRSAFFVARFSLPKLQLSNYQH